MRRPLPLERELVDATRPITVRAIRLDDPSDVEGFLRVNNRAFHWHPEQGGWNADRLAATVAEPWFDPAGFLVHDGGTVSTERADPDGTSADATSAIDGFCWTKVHPPGHTDPDDPVIGEIFVIAADPSTHGSGLGRALTVAGLEHLARAGIGVGMLYVEADNAPAVSLYERLGFTVHHSDAAYRRT
jgi:mycothiol synthase